MRAPAPRTIPLSRFGLMTVREFPAYHNVTPGQAGRWVLDGRLSAVPVSRAVLVRRADCERFVKSGMGRPRGAKNRPKRGAKKRPTRGAAVVVIPLSEFGLLTVAEVAEYHGRRTHAVWCWVARGYSRPSRSTGASSSPGPTARTSSRRRAAARDGGSSPRAR